MKTFHEFILECYNIFEGSEIAGRLADLAKKRQINYSKEIGVGIQIEHKYKLIKELPILLGQDL